MTDASTKAEQLAAERYRIIAVDGVPSGHEVRNAFIDGYLARTVITAEELETAAKARLIKRGYLSRHSIPKHDFKYEVDLTRAAFEAVGFTVEGGE